MKFNFKIQQYQTDAVDAVVNVFAGQPYSSGVSYIRDTGTLNQKPQQLSFLALADNPEQMELEDLLRDSGYKNEAVALSDDQLLQNIHTLQSQNNIKLSPELVNDMGRCSLDIEMETGTGKTYVYIKTMFELNKKYGWSKFIVVVPSIAIREGVKKSFEITTDHFMEYYGKKARFFVYNSANLNQLDNFSSNSGINVMIISYRIRSDYRKGSDGAVRGKRSWRVPAASVQYATFRKKRLSRRCDGGTGGRAPWNTGSDCR